jgi:hypothetical protein
MNEALIAAAAAVLGAAVGAGGAIGAGFITGRRAVDAARVQVEQTALVSHQEWLRTKRFDAYRELMQAARDLPGEPGEASIGEVRSQLLEVWQATQALRALVPSAIRDVIDQLAEPVGDALGNPDERTFWDPGRLYEAYRNLEQMMWPLLQEPSV